MKKTISIILAALMLMGAFSLSSLAAEYDVAAGVTKDLVEAGDEVNFNYGTVLENRGTITINQGSVEKNYGSGDDHYSNTVIRNYSTGSVYIIHNGSTVRNFGGYVGVILGGTVINYKKVTATLAGVTVSGLTEENGETWVEQGGEFVITPNEGFAFEAAPTVSGEAQLKQNDDGSYTVYEIMSDITVEASAVEEKEKTNSAAFFELLIRFFKLLFFFLEMTCFSKGV